MSVWDFIQDQVLGMQWLNDLLGRLLSALGLDVNGRIGGSIQFFIYDVLKILILLCVLIFVISYIQSYFPPERSKRILGRFRGIWANVIAALLGTVTPFCSCSSIPLFIGFTSAGDLFLLDFFPHGGFGKSGASHEHLWREGRGNLCDTWLGHCSHWRYDH